MKQPMTKLKQKMTELKLKPSFVADKRGVPRSTVTRHMQLGIKTLRIAEKYAAVIGCDPLELLG